MPFISNSSRDDAGDVELMVGGNRYPVIVNSALRASGWRGGQWVRYVSGTEDFVVGASDGNSAAGFLLQQSENYTFGLPFGEGPGSPDNWTSRQPRNGEGGQNVVTMVNDGCRCFFKVYETVALVGGARVGGAITYSLQETLYVSENGLLCNDSILELVAAGVAVPLEAGIVSAVPSSLNGDRLGVDVKF